MTEISPPLAGNPPFQQSTLTGIVICVNKAGSVGVVETATTASFGSLTSITQVTDNGTTAKTLEATLDPSALAALDQFCSSEHVAVDFVPFSFTLVLSIVNPDGTVDKNGSIAAACVHPNPASIKVVTTGPNRGGVTGDPYDCDQCPFLDAFGDGFADVAGCASCVNTDGTLNGACPTLGQKASPH